MLAKTPITDTYLTAEQLGITEAERDALIWVREELASGRIKHDPERVGNGTFNMLLFDGGNCGTVHCIGGWMRVHGALINTDMQGYPTGSLFYPSIAEAHVWKGHEDLTAEDAVRAIDLWATGHQADCWTLALSKN